MQWLKLAGRIHTSPALTTMKATREQILKENIRGVRRKVKKRMIPQMKMKSNILLFCHADSAAKCLQLEAQGNTMKSTCTWSRRVSSVKILKELGVEKCFQIQHHLGITSWRFTRKPLCVKNVWKGSPMSGNTWSTEEVSWVSQSHLQRSSVKSVSNQFQEIILEDTWQKFTRSLDITPFKNQLRSTILALIVISSSKERKTWSVILKRNILTRSQEGTFVNSVGNPSLWNEIWNSTWKIPTHHSFPLLIVITVKCHSN